MSLDVDVDEFEQQQWDPFEIRNKQPGMKYRFLNRNSRNIQQKLRQGYEIVKDTDPEELMMSESTPIKAGEQLDTTKRFSDLILARISEEKLKKMERYNRFLIRRRNASIAQQFKSVVGDLGFDATADTGYHSKMTSKEFERIGSGGKKG